MNSHNYLSHESSNRLHIVHLTGLRAIQGNRSPAQATQQQPRPVPSELGEAVPVPSPRHGGQERDRAPLSESAEGQGEGEGAHCDSPDQPSGTRAGAGADCTARYRSTRYCQSGTICSKQLRQPGRWSWQCQYSTPGGAIMPAVWISDWCGDRAPHPGVLLPPEGDIRGQLLDGL